MRHDVGGLFLERGKKEDTRCDMVCVAEGRRSEKGFGPRILVFHPYLLPTTMPTRTDREIHD